MACNATDSAMCAGKLHQQFTYNGEPYTPNMWEQLWLDMFAGQQGETSELQWKCMRKLMFNHIFIQLPMMLGFHSFAELFGMKIIDVFPTWQSFLLQIAIFFVVEDFYYYCVHRMLHIPIFYKHIHKVHHEFSAPFGITAEYAHPIETVVLGLGTIGAPCLWAMATGDLHVMTVFAWVTLRLLQTLDAHSGYDFPFSLRHWLPFWGGADHHDIITWHFFRWWDTLFGTDLKYIAYKKQQGEEAATLAAKKAE
ncbi:hypothetical protein BDF22DRAFT_735624 [Syncephalis plumigaleata]|nr:hypothetical protein BDF22DRAFT_735624 [Syncephalis plumigaleata]